MKIRNAILYFVVFCTLFFKTNTVILYLVIGYVENQTREIFTSFASLVTLALAPFFQKSASISVKIWVAHSTAEAMAKRLSGSISS